jgi:hypothetical protein
VAAPGAPAPRRGRRLRGWLATLAILAIVGAAAWLIVARLRKGYEYRAEATAVLTELASGDPARVRAVYDAASPRFKQTLIVDKLLDLADRMHGTFGGFRRVLDVTRVRSTRTVDGRAADVEVLVEFDRGRTTGSLAFVREPDGATRLLGFAIEIPEGELEAKARALAAEQKRTAAPEVVVAAVEEILRHLQEGQLDAVRAGAAPAFRTSVSAEALADLTRGHAQELGGFVRLVKVVSSALSPAHDRARVQALLEYERRRTTATFDFQNVGGGWQLLAFQVDVVAPSPTRATATQGGAAPAPPP